LPEILAVDLTFEPLLLRPLGIDFKDTLEGS
jgi:hypothetical protein